MILNGSLIITKDRENIRIISEMLSFESSALCSLLLDKIIKIARVNNVAYFYVIYFRR